MRKFPEAPDRKLELRMPKNGPKGTRKKLILFQQWPLNWKDLFSAATGKVAMCPIMGTLVPSSDSNRCLC